MSETPITDAVHKAACGLGAGSNSVIPDDYPPCCPWELSQELEKKNNRLKADVKQFSSNLAEQYKHSELLLNQINKLQTENQKLRDDLANADRGNELSRLRMDEMRAEIERLKNKDKSLDSIKQCWWQKARWCR